MGRAGERVPASISTNDSNREIVTIRIEGYDNLPTENMEPKFDLVHKSYGHCCPPADHNIKQNCVFGRFFIPLARAPLLFPR